ncbi:MAG: ATPase P [Deltaproteobacteria bacterium]|jgi:soluble P-type ATPase|nr:ATPase P [Deltaproteobacteria bacterium]
MIAVDIPGGAALRLERLVLDYNGTLALDGLMLNQAKTLLLDLSMLLRVHVVTADTFGLAEKELSDLPLSLKILPPGGQAKAKLDFITCLGPEKCAAVGNGLNDALMVAAAALGLAVLGPEGAAKKTLEAADVVCPSIESALGLLLSPKRLIATLRT